MRLMYRYAILRIVRQRTNIALVHLGYCALAVDLDLWTFPGHIKVDFLNHCSRRSVELS